MKPQTSLRFYLGCYTQILPHVEGRGTGISCVEYDPAVGDFVTCFIQGGVTNPSYLLALPDKERLYAIEEQPAADGSSLVTYHMAPEDGALTEISRVPVGGDWPCHIATDTAKTRLFLSNYMSGSLTIWSLDAAGLPQGAAQIITHSGSSVNPERQEGPHVHCALAPPDGETVVVCDAGTDEILRYKLIADDRLEESPCEVIKAPPGSLPRHIVLSADGGRLFVVHELGNHVTAYKITPGALLAIGSTGTLPNGIDPASSATAAIRLHPNGQFLYVSNRGHDSITLFDVSDPEKAPVFVATFPTGGLTPRDFNLSTDGSVLLVAHQDSHSVCAMTVSSMDGKLTGTGHVCETNSPVCVAIV